MANGDGHDDSGSKDRATVALAVEKIDHVREMMRAEFSEVRERLTRVEGLPERVTILTEKHSALERRVGQIEKDDEKHIEWRRGVLVTATTLLVGIIVNVGITFHWF